MTINEQSVFNARIRQIALLTIIILLAVLLFKQLYGLFPGFLGAITLYILFRNLFFKLTIVKRWNPTLVAIGIILSTIIILSVPIYIAFNMLVNKVQPIIQNPTELLNDAKVVGNKIKEITGTNILSDENINIIQQKITNFLPKFINSSASILGNFALMFFLLYFLLIKGRYIEKKLDTIIPLHEESIDMLGNETIGIIRACAIGIPVLAISQGIVATIAYAIFKVKDYALWGFLTGVFSLVPIIGTAVIWVPISIYLYATGNHGLAIGLFIFGAVFITNIDYPIRLTLMKRFINVHPLITIFGVIVGVGLFGFWGVIFGPLLISYFIVLVRIYMREFGIREKEIENRGEEVLEEVNNETENSTSADQQTQPNQ